MARSLPLPGRPLAWALAAALCCAAPALAGAADSGGIVMSPPPVSGPPGLPILPSGMPAFMNGGRLVATNTAIGTNIAAGIGNQASQRLALGQRGSRKESSAVGGGVTLGSGPLVSLDTSGRGPLVTTNVGVGTNVAAGLGNAAGQRFLSRQR